MWPPSVTAGTPSAMPSLTAAPAERNALLHKAEVILANEAFSIPLFSRPAYLLNSTKVKGTIKNPTQQGSTWNAETWSVTS